LYQKKKKKRKNDDCEVTNDFKIHFFEKLKRKTNLILILGCRDSTSKLEPQQKDVFHNIFEMIDKYNLYGKVAYPKKHLPSQIPALYRWAASRGGVFVNPALTEPFGLTLLEASSCG